MSELILSSVAESEMAVGLAARGQTAGFAAASTLAVEAMPDSDGVTTDTHPASAKTSTGPDSLDHIFIHSQFIVNVIINR